MRRSYLYTLSIRFYTMNVKIWTPHTVHFRKQHQLLSMTTYEIQRPNWLDEKSRQVIPKFQDHRIATWPSSTPSSPSSSTTSWARPPSTPSSPYLTTNSWGRPISTPSSSYLNAINTWNVEPLKNFEAYCLYTWSSKGKVFTRIKRIVLQSNISAFIKEK